MRRVRVILLWAVVAATVVAGYPGAFAASVWASATTTPTTHGPAGPLPWLHVEHPADGDTPYIADPQGRRVILRGVVAAGLVDYWSGSDPNLLAPPPYFPIDPPAYANGQCPINSAEIWIPPLCRNDLAEMRALGFNVLRLGLSWSLLEPDAGRYDQRYLDRIAQVVGWAREEGIYVLLDMHSNAYSRYVGRADPLPGGDKPHLDEFDGAPAWATFPDFLPAERFANKRELTPAMWQATTWFWLNRAGIQDRYVAAVAELARRFKDDSTVIGYSLYNEPWPGWILPPAFDDLLLYPFYRRVIDAVTGAAGGLPCGLPVAICGQRDLGVGDRAHLFFLEPGDAREITDFPTHFASPISSYPNLVLSMHAYTHIYTLDAVVGRTSDSWPPYDQSYWWAEQEARQLHAALFVSEFGNDPRDDQKLLTNQLLEMERHRVGSTFWVWKQNCGYNRPWGMFEGVYGALKNQICAYDRGLPDTMVRPQSGCLLADRERLLARIWPAATPPGPFSYHYDPATGGFAMTGSTPAAGEVVLVVPPEVTGGDGPEERRMAVGPGAYTITLPAAALHLTGCAYV